MAGGCGTRCWRPEAWRLLDVVDGVLGPDVLATTAVDHQKHPLQQPNDPVAELGADSIS